MKINFAFLLLFFFISFISMTTAIKVNNFLFTIHEEEEAKSALHSQLIGNIRENKGPEINKGENLEIMKEADLPPQNKYHYYNQWSENAKKDKTQNIPKLHLQKLENLRDSAVEEYREKVHYKFYPDHRKLGDVEKYRIPELKKLSNSEKIEEINLTPKENYDYYNQWLRNIRKHDTTSTPKILLNKLKGLRDTARKQYEEQLGFKLYPEPGEGSYWDIYDGTASAKKNKKIELKMVGL
ncbi:hypothetical protein BY996DRAFT_678645 [Phakopsora pachyrhizi]|uniref:Expressed protein n=1 Tax=Phakopsora pachyrhizi TaxID=170000 RepID=A0AAV0BAP4_PHAPC|nr:hypothetical protein BY996DRAFT_678645 [Phakopsora pachyrhizi]CAH7682707.1 expressed protein [Phakopsora pachyrhizi]